MFFAHAVISMTTNVFFYLTRITLTILDNPEYVDGTAGMVLLTLSQYDVPTEILFVYNCIMFMFSYSLSEKFFWVTTLWCNWCTIENSSGYLVHLGIWVIITYTRKPKAVRQPPSHKNKYLPRSKSIHLDTWNRQSILIKRNGVFSDKYLCSYRHKLLLMMFCFSRRIFMPPPVLQELYCFPRRLLIFSFDRVSYIIWKVFESTFQNPFCLCVCLVCLYVCTTIFKWIVGLHFYPKSLMLYINGFVWTSSTD